MRDWRPNVGHILFRWLYPTQTDQTVRGQRCDLQRPSGVFEWAQQSLPCQQNKTLPPHSDTSHVGFHIDITVTRRIKLIFHVHDQISLSGGWGDGVRVGQQGIYCWQLTISANHRYIWGWHWYQTWYQTKSKTSKPACFSKGKQTISIRAIAEHNHLFFRGRSTISRSFCGNQNQVDIFKKTLRQFTAVIVVKLQKKTDILDRKLWCSWSPKQAF